MKIFIKIICIVVSSYFSLFYAMDQERENLSALEAGRIQNSTLTTALMQQANEAAEQECQAFFLNSDSIFYAMDLNDPLRQQLYRDAMGKGYGSVQSANSCHDKHSEYAQHTSSKFRKLVDNAAVCGLVCVIPAVLLTIMVGSMLVIPLINEKPTHCPYRRSCDLLNTTQPDSNGYCNIPTYNVTDFINMINVLCCLYNCSGNVTLKVDY